MEEEISRMKTFLKEFNNDQQIQSPTSEEITYTRVGNYGLDPEDVNGQVIDWILNYLDNKNCPYSLALSIAKEVAQQVSASFANWSENVTENEEKSCNSSAIYAEAISKLPAICNSFLNQTNLKPNCSSKYTTSVFAIKNKRRKMEDKYVIHHDLNAVVDLKDAPHHSYYAVFDGHSGKDAACYTSAQLHFNIAKHPDFFTDTTKAIIEGYQITDLNFLNKCNKWSNIKSGCTVVSALIRENTVYLSWLGDSQAILVKEGVPLTLTNPHKPDREDEKRRIESLGGYVSHMGTWRVNGLLAVTRAIGDPDQKRFITSEPELSVLNLDGSEDFLILACDGLWDGMSPEDVTGVLYRYLADSSPDEPLDAVAAKLVHQSKLQGSEDNITAIVIFLRDIKTIKENSAKFMTSSYCVQDHDFLSMNGNTRTLDLEHASDTPFSKPTVLELNAASSKKLKNAANVMSSAGFGGSYTCQYGETTSEGMFQNIESSVMDTAQGMFHCQNVTASCFAPEATALSELPTPPIDDMLASQQSENFYSTDLYKEFSNSVHSSQVTEISNSVESSTVANETRQSSTLDSPTKPTNNTAADISSMSLLTSDSISSVNSETKISAHEAVGVASTVVSTAIETAVKCLSSNEVKDSVPTTSPIKLNPYAKPFVMKSFFNPEESESTTCLGNEASDVSLTSGPELSKPFVTETATDLLMENTIEKLVSDLSGDGMITESIASNVADSSIPNQPVNQSVIDFVESEHTTKSEIKQNIVQDSNFDILNNPFEKPVSDLSGDGMITESIASNVADSSIPNQPVNQSVIDFVESEHTTKSEIKQNIVQDSNFNILNNPFESSINQASEQSTDDSFKSDIKSSNFPAEDLTNVLNSDIAQKCPIDKGSDISEENVLIITKTAEIALEEAKFNISDLSNKSVSVSGDNTSVKDLNDLMSSDVCNDVILSPVSSNSSIIHPKTPEQKSVDVTDQSSSVNLSEEGQNLDSVNKSVSPTFENTSVISENKSKHEDNEKCIVAITENCHLESTSFVEDSSIIHPKTPEKKSVDVTDQSSSVNLSEEGQNLDSVNKSVSPTFENTSVISENKSKHEDNEKCIVAIPENCHLESTSFVEDKLSSMINTLPDPTPLEIQPKSPTQELSQKEFNTSASSLQSSSPSDNQNSNSGLTSENLLLSSSDKESKCVAIEKHIVDTVEKNIIETSQLIENMPGEPISLLDIKNELIPAEAEVPSDPSVDDSHAEAVAVDLKSLPVGIPEAEGVTEDIDSDSEKDGGWSYMKGNTVSGSKSKPVGKTAETLKSNEAKSNIAAKGRRDITKPNLDIKSKMKSATTDKTKNNLADKMKNTTVEKPKNVVADKSKGIATVDKTKTPVDKTKTLSSVDKTKTLASVDKTKKAVAEKKPDIKTRVMKSSTLSTAARITSDKTTNRATGIKKETSETTKTAPAATKPPRPTTLVRANVPASKPVSTIAADRNVTSKVTMKPKVGSALAETKSTVKTTTSTLLKGQTVSQSKSSTTSTRVTTTRPATTVPNKTSTIAKSSVQKSVASELKPKQPSSATASTLKKPITNTIKKSEVKEVKDSVNKQIVAKKNTTTSKVDSSSTLLSKRVASASTKSTVSRVASSTARSATNKRDVPKAPGLKSTPKSVGLKVSQDSSSKEKDTKVESVQSKTEEAKNTLNIESDQKTMTEIVQVAEKFTLETSDKEMLVKEKCEDSSQDKNVEGSLSNPISPAEDKTPNVECTPENL